VASYNFALKLKPDLAQAHFSLSGLYQEMGYADLTLIHLQAYLESTRAAGRQAGETAGEFNDRIANLEDTVGKVDKEVKNRTENYLINSANYKVLDQARQAAKNGLAGKARDILMASNVAAFGTEGTRLQLGLMLSTGMVDKLREWRKEDENDEWKDALGEYEFELLQAQIEAATGDYEMADEHLGKLIAAVVPPSGEKQPAFSLRSRMALTLGRSVLQGSSPEFGGVWQFWLRLGEFESQRQVQGFAANLRQQADLIVVRGLLDLECGETQRAREKFDEALSVWRSDADAAAGTGVDFKGRFIAQECLEKLASSGR
jgi:tetratricopeptide (TPR) repeat protein